MIISKDFAGELKPHFSLCPQFYIIKHQACYRYSFPFLLILFFLLISAQISLPQNISFERHPVDLNFPGIQYIKIIDIDGDYDLDIIGGSEITPYSSSKGIAYWRNDGGLPINWTKIVIDSTFIHVMSVDAAYIDADSNIDIVASSWQLHQVAWWKNSGNPETGWTKYIVKSGYGNAHDAKCADIDQDGDTDIIMAASTPGSIDICYNENINEPSWNSVQIGPGFSGAKSVLIIDLDLDTDYDIVGTADGVNDIAWWENTGINSQVWSKRFIDNNFVGAAFTDVIYMDEDVAFDIVATAWSSNQTAYWICNDLTTNSWTKHIVSSSLQIPVRTFGRDFDMDDDIDLVVVGKSPGVLTVFTNENSNWSEQVLQSNFSGGSALAVEDLDKDGDIDIIAGASVLADIYWWENQTINTSSVTTKNLLLLNFYLGQNYPNPFNPITKITYHIPELSFVTLSVYNVLGNKLETLINQENVAGTYTIEFDATSLPSGIYFYQLRAGTFVDIKKMVLMK